MGPKKTLERIKYSFFWEGLRADVKKFCESCKEYQLTQSTRDNNRSPISSVARPELPPFQVVNMDLIGPIDPPSSKEHKYTLCLVDQYIREIPHSNTGVSPFQLLYGRQPQGSLSIFKSTWMGKHNNLQLCTTPISKYLIDLKSKLKKTAEQAKLVTAVQQENMTYYHNLRLSDKVFQVGEKAIGLIHDSTSKLFEGWQGPATNIEKRNPHSFLVKMPNNSTKHIHQNKLRHYRASSNSVNVIFEEKEFGQVETPPTATEESKFYEVLDNLLTGSRVFSLTCPLGSLGAELMATHFQPNPRSEA
ncbi:retrovirus-related Pol polyprotein from transposon opus [Trichonephila clavipes]|uniref:RNA-directed DNA polymerase n=1 Tax=Trichonephila clavipes TaxID=2585209 RepID=A0A8X6SRG6_TRICX|nr:retrovirus-related Pol polyprotein from transposon opus [Trichonephila clavipes]